jgi:hypothetical protein
MALDRKRNISVAHCAAMRLGRAKAKPKSSANIERNQRIVEQAIELKRTNQLDRLLDPQRL